MTIKWVGSPNFDTNRKPIDRIVLHWIVGTLAAADAVFQDDLRDTSAHYGIGQEEIHQYVEENNVAYHAGNYEMNQRSIGIEHEGGPDLPITDAVYNQSIELITYLCQKYNIPATDYYIIPHRQVKATQCPGTLDLQRIIAGVKMNLAPPPPGDNMNEEQKKVFDFIEANKDEDNLESVVRKWHGAYVDLPKVVEERERLKTDLAACQAGSTPPNPSDYTIRQLISLLLKKLLSNE